MIITSPGYMQTRSLEVGLGAAMLVSGVIFMMPGETLANPAFMLLRTWMPAWMSEETGGAVLAVAAAARWIALHINSHHRSTPLIRCAGCAVGAGFWLTASVSIATAVPAMPATPWLLGLTAILAGQEMYSGFRTGLDAEALDSLGFRRRAHLRRRREKALA